MRRRPPQTAFHMLRLFTLVIVTALLPLPSPVQAQVTLFDTLGIKHLRLGREFLFRFAGATGENEADFRTNQRRNKLQKQFSANEPFFCDVHGPGRRSAVPPQSVHKLRPGDIDIVGAIGDSLTAGNGGLATNIFQVATENKGLSWTIGGQKTWREFLTIPNILKEYNPQLYGYSVTDGLGTHRSSKFNVAEIGAMSRDTPHQARNLVARMRNDPNVDIQNHWKLVSFLIGPNDFCLDMCYYPDPEIIVQRHERELTEVLRTIRDNLPRTFMQVVVSPLMDILLRFKGKPLSCESTHYIECPCFFSHHQRPNRDLYLDVQRKWQEKQREVVYREEFQTQNFTVVLQEFTRHLKFPRSSQTGNTDFTYMSEDCFHFSQKGYALASNALWNNMLEPVGTKATNWKREFSEFKCPSEEKPFLATRENS